MIEEAQLEKNKLQFHKINAKYGILTESYLEVLSKDDALFMSPASTSKDMNGAYPGGLIELIFLACKHALNINGKFPENLKVDDGLIVKSLVLSQLGKVGMFKFNESEWHRNNLGKLYEFVNDKISMKYNERALYNATSNGVELTEEQYQCLLNIDKGPDDLMSKTHSTILTDIVKTGLHLGVIEQKNLV